MLEGKLASLQFFLFDYVTVDEWLILLTQTDSAIGCCRGKMVKKQQEL